MLTIQGKCRVTISLMNRAPLSSMFTILSLFTEDVKLRHDKGAKETVDAVQSELKAGKSDAAGVTSASNSPRLHFAQSRGSSGGGTRNRSSTANLQDLPHIPLLNPPGEGRAQSSSVHPGVLARANIDTTIAVIPAEVCLPCQLITKPRPFED